MALAEPLQALEAGHDAAPSTDRCAKGVLLPITAETIWAIFRFEPRRGYPSSNERRRAP
jgi:hypothetical protein